MTVQDQTPSQTGRHRRRGDDPSKPSRRIGVIWSADVKIPGHRSWSTVLDISPDGAKVRTDTLLLGGVDTFDLDVQSLGSIKCAPVWQRDGRVGVRFLSGRPSMARLRELVGLPPLEALA